MLKKRIIACLDVKNGRTVKGTNFLNLKDAGDATELAANYANQGVDELVFLDISATNEERKTIVSLVSKVAQKLNVPFTVGGGISSLDDAIRIIESGADKVSVNSAAIKKPILIDEIARRYGSQCVVVAVDVKFEEGQHAVYAAGGTKKTGLFAKNWCTEAVNRGGGEILLTSMDSDGTKNGFNIELASEISTAVRVPVIASGGAGSMEHFAQVFQQTNASAALAASVFHFGHIQIPVLKSFLKQQNIPIR